VAKEQNVEFKSDSTKSQVISFWNSLGNVGVLSSTDKNFIDELKRWANANGYRVEDVR